MQHAVEQAGSLKRLEPGLNSSEKANCRHRHFDGPDRHALYCGRDLPQLVAGISLDLDAAAGASFHASLQSGHVLLIGVVDGR